MESTQDVRSQHQSLPTSLLQLLSNSLVLSQIAPYLPLFSLLELGSTSKSFQALIRESPLVFRHLDLTKVKSAQFEIAAIDHGGEVWRNVQLDENVTEDDFYGGPLRGIFNILRRRQILRDVHTLILDGLSATSDLVSDIILQIHFNVRILSIREVQNLNERKLQQALLYAVRPSRPENTPRLHSLYIFGAKDIPTRLSAIGEHYSSDITSDGGVMSSQGAQIGAEWNHKSASNLAEELVHGADKWYQGRGKVIARSPSMEWANTMFACQGIIGFDAVLCQGPRHAVTVTQGGKAMSPWYQSSGAHLSSRVATHSIGGCAGCKKSPEGVSRFKISPMDRFPLLAPPPLHSSNAKSAKRPFLGSEGRLLVRCMDCLRHRYCENCHIWWCEDCYDGPEQNPALMASGPSTTGVLNTGVVGSCAKQNVKAGVRRSCFECGSNCDNCISKTQLLCRLCGGGYCTVHNEGSTLTTCDCMGAHMSDSIVANTRQGVLEAVVGHGKCTD